ncbi:BadF/BadG/BcrA/BcrD ATPase family protein [uncultured Klebsiella sp.]|uniref:BadF/BadG/BcrA/BcrD ATPase family protein n=1 Tax=uncultured Klebsiella sp. TaxID=284011 RepID=UPI0028055B30|nr:BadF/BadG/BcrA/BcrD ATPase family protein [uncultured Klebsiella sp.]
MRSEYFISVDGGGTQCRTQLINKEGQTLASLTGGSANIWSDFTGAMTQATQLIAETLRLAGLGKEHYSATTAILGLAGANVLSARQRAQLWPHDFGGWHVFSDVETACLGAHSGQPGAVLVIGTGSQGAVWDGSGFHCVGGWGLLLSDHGSGSLLGHQALRLALQAHEGLQPMTPLTHALMAQFDHSPQSLLSWSASASPAQWGQFSPLIFAHAAENDSNGVALVKARADETTLLINHLTHQGDYPVALMGGLAEPLLPWLAPEVQRQIVPPAQNALAGALQWALARNY